MSKRVRNFRLQRMVLCAVAAVFLVGAAQVTNSMPVPQDSDGSQGSGTPKVITKKLPDAKVGTPYIIIIQGMGGKTPWDFSVKGQPKGLSMDTVRGPNTSDALHGTPTEAGDFNVELTVNDSNDPPRSSTSTLKLHVAP